MPLHREVSIFPRSCLSGMPLRHEPEVTAIRTDRRYLDMSLLKSKDVVVAKAA